MNTRHLLIALGLALCGAAQAQGSGNFCIVRTPSLQGSYAGDCVAGYASGRGRAQGAADRYEGSWRDGQPTGQGIYTFADGSRFEGEFVEGAVNGRARFYYVNGDVLEGEFRNNLLAGIGRMQRGNGEQVPVQVVNGAIVQVAAAGAPAHVPGPGAPAGDALSVPQVCGQNLRMTLHSLRRAGSGQVEAVVSYENLLNVDLVLSLYPRGGRDQDTRLVDGDGETWHLVSHQGAGWRRLPEAFLPGVRTRVAYTFQRIAGGQEASAFILLNPINFGPTRAVGDARVSGTCRFELRGLKPGA